MAKKNIPSDTCHHCLKHCLPCTGLDATGCKHPTSGSLHPHPWSDNNSGCRTMCQPASCTFQSCARPVDSTFWTQKYCYTHGKIALAPTACIVAHRADASAVPLLAPPLLLFRLHNSNALAQYRPRIMSNGVLSSVEDEQFMPEVSGSGPRLSFEHCYYASSRLFGVLRPEDPGRA